MASGSSAQFTYLLGSTLLAVPTGAAIQVLAPAGCNGVYFGWQSGGTLAVAPGIGASTGNSFVLSTTERINLDGPASFFLASNGSTSVAGIVFKYSSGFSLR